MSPTREELYEQATELEIEGRSSMSKDELEKAVESALEAPAQDEGSQVSEDDQELLEQASEDVAAAQDDPGETGTPVEEASKPKPKAKGSTGRGVGFHR